MKNTIEFEVSSSLALLPTLTQAKIITRPLTRFQPMEHWLEFDIVNISFHELIWKILHHTPTGVQRPCADQGYRGREASWVFNA